MCGVLSMSEPGARQQTLTAALVAAVAALAAGAAAWQAPAAADREAAPGEPRVTNAVQVTANPDPSRAHSSPQIARNPTNGELAIVETEVRSDRSCRIHISADNGQS
jgi:DMSO/TMAO reductase YedYZ molybdopterin-dependent catalytic subunit